MATSQAKSESIAKSNAALARLMAKLPAAAPVTTETKTKAAQKAARLAEQDKVIAANAQKVITKKPATKASALAKQGDTAKAVAVKISVKKAREIVKENGEFSQETLAKFGIPEAPAPSPVVVAKAKKVATQLVTAEKGLTTAEQKAKIARVTKVLVTPAKANAKKALANVAAKAVTLAKAAAVVPAKRPNVKVAILDLFYSNLDLQLSTMETVLALQHQYAGMNESSIRVWITDLRKDGTLVKVETRDGKDILTAGTPGEQWGLRGTTSTFALAHKGKPLRVPPAAPVKVYAAIPASLQVAIVNATKAWDKMVTEFNRLLGTQA